MVKLTFFKGSPNTSLEIGDLAYYIGNPTMQAGSSGIVTSDYNSGNNGESNYILIGVVSAIMPFTETESTLTYGMTTAQPGFFIYVEEQPVGFVPPAINDFIFFAKNNAVELSSIKGYYANVNFINDSKKKAELFSVACGVAVSSK